MMICKKKYRLKNNVYNINILYIYGNHLRSMAIQKLLEMIGRVRSYPRLLVATTLNWDINQGGHPSM